MLDYARKAKSYALDYDGGPVNVDLLPIRFSKNALLPNNIAFLLAAAVVLRLLPFPRLRRALMRLNGTLARLESVKVVAAVAGGDSFSDLYGIRRFLYVSLPILLALALRKPLVLLPQSYGPYRSRPARLLAAFIVSRSVRAYSRTRAVDPAINGRVAGRRGTKVVFAHDMAFTLPSSRPVSAEARALLNAIGDHTGPVVGINVSGLLYIGGYSGDNMFGLRDSYPQCLERLVSSFADDGRARVVLIPHVGGSGPHRESDARAVRAVTERIAPRFRGRLLTAPVHLDQREMKFLIGACDFLVGSRMHACIAALSQGVPAAALAYSDKFAGVFESIGMQRLVVDLRTTPCDEVVRVVLRAFDERTETARELRGSLGGVRAGIESVFASLANVI
jgi:colanic acid/amylovoran biosynthesis protein